MAFTTTLLFKYFAVLLMLGLPLSNGQTLDIEDILSKLNETIYDDMLKALQDKGLQGVEKKCKANAGDTWNHVYDNVKQEVEVSKNCTKNFINLKEFVKKVSDAKQNGKLDEVFKEYCDRKGELLKCITDFTNAGKPCLNDKEKENLPIVERLFEQLSEFICHRNGDRIALFIAEKGPECMSANSEKVQTCLSPYFKNSNVTNINVTNINETSINPDTIASFQVPDNINSFNLDFDDEFCRNMDVARECIVNELISCEEPTPSNIADALFKYVKKALPCNNAAQLESKATKSKASITTASILSVAAALMLL